jgi:hypothetical protein
MTDSTEPMVLYPTVATSAKRRTRRRVRRRVDRWETVHTCRKCVGGRLLRVHRRSFFEFVCSWFGSYPFTCDTCHQPSNRIRIQQFIGGALLAGIACCFLGATLYVLRHNHLILRRQQKESVLARESNHGPVGPAFPKYAPKYLVDETPWPEPGSLADKKAGNVRATDSRSPLQAGSTPGTAHGDTTHKPSS